MFDLTLVTMVNVLQPKARRIVRPISIKVPQSYANKFEAAVKNFEQLAEEEKVLRSKAVQMRFASYF